MSIVPDYYGIDFERFIFIGNEIAGGICNIPKEDLEWFKEQKLSIKIALKNWHDPIPKISNYANGLDSGQGNLDLDTLPALFKALNEAWEIAGEGENVKHGDTDEADSIGGIMTRIWEKYQGKATIEQRQKWQDARTGQ